VTVFFNKLGGDDFLRPDENPLNGGKWTQNAGFQPFQIVSHVCEAVGLNQSNDMLFSGVDMSLYPDQYAKANVTLLSGTQTGFDFEMRSSDNDNTTYTFELDESGTGTYTYGVSKFINGTPTNFTLNQPIPFVNGDSMSAAVIGNTLYFFHNDVLFYSFTDSVSPVTSGGISVFAFAEITQNSMQFTNFEVGQASLTPFSGAYSVPDCRNFGSFPNTSRTVQGTKIYDLQTSSNHAIPGTDSRAAGAPVDSRVSPNIPQNSRTPGTYGPGVN
jgi:hypothetical protein